MDIHSEIVNNLPPITGGRGGHRRCWNLDVIEEVTEGIKCKCKLCGKESVLPFIKQVNVNGEII